MTDSNGFLKRSDLGRFAPGTAPGPGRPKGKPNNSTIDARTLRSRIVGSWERVNGDEKLDQLAERDFTAYLRAVAGLIPRNDPPLESQELLKQVETVLEEYGQEVCSRAIKIMLGFLAAIPSDLIAEFLQKLVPGENRMTEEEAIEFLDSLGDPICDGDAEGA